MAKPLNMNIQNLFLNYLWKWKIILRKHNKFGVIDFNGTTLIGFNYDTITVTSDGYAIVEVNDKYGVVDLEGNTIIPILYDNIPYRNIPCWGLE